jgi:hypothetical protein
MAAFLGARPPLAERGEAHASFCQQRTRTTRCHRSQSTIIASHFSLPNHNNNASGDKDESESAKLWHPQCPKRRMLLLTSTRSNRDGVVSTTAWQQKEKAPVLSANKRGSASLRATPTRTFNLGHPNQSAPSKT